MSHHLDNLRTLYDRDDLDEQDWIEWDTLLADYFSQSPPTGYSWEEITLNRILGVYNDVFDMPINIHSPHADVLSQALRSFQHRGPRCTAHASAILH